MTTPSPAPIPTQTPAPPLARALNLLDGLLSRDDVPSAVRSDLAGVYDDLVDVRPPYPPTTPTDTHTQPWPAVVHDAADALHELIGHLDPATAPAGMLRHALALRALRVTAQKATTQGPTAQAAARDDRGGQDDLA